jgi:hypothetical protein
MLLWGCSNSTEPAENTSTEDQGVVDLLSDGMWEVSDAAGAIDEENVRIRFKFNTNHTVSIYALMPDPGSDWEFVNLVTWKLEENSTKIIFPSEPSLAPAKITKLSDTELILYFIEEEVSEYYIKVQE